MADMWILTASNGLPGILRTTMRFAAGSYTLSFDLGGNVRGDGSKTTVVTLGNFSQTITLGSRRPPDHYSLTVDTSGGQLDFPIFQAGTETSAIFSTMYQSHLPSPSLPPG